MNFLSQTSDLHFCAYNGFFGKTVEMISDICSCVHIDTPWMYISHLTTVYEPNMVICKRTCLYKCKHTG